MVKYQGDDADIPIYVPKQLQAMDYDWLYRKCVEGKYKYGCNLILIDHLHFMVDMQTKQNMSLNIGAFMRRLKKDIAIDLEMAVILIAHQGQPKEDQEASLHNLRDSSFIAQESDCTIIVQRKKNLSADEESKYQERIGYLPEELKPPVFDLGDYSANLAIVKVAVNRRTGVFDWKKMFKKVGNFMEEIL
jgi:replicative DNA helicase